MYHLNTSGAESHHKASNKHPPYIAVLYVGRVYRCFVFLTLNWLFYTHHIPI